MFFLLTTQRLVATDQLINSRFPKYLGGSVECARNYFVEIRLKLIALLGDLVLWRVGLLIFD
jgi:hypothetical protein